MRLNEKTHSSAQWLLRKLPSLTVAGAAPELNRLPISFCWMISRRDPEESDFKGLVGKFQVTGGKGSEETQVTA